VDKLERLQRQKNCAAFNKLLNFLILAFLHLTQK